MSQCPKCGGYGVRDYFLWPRENMEDLHCECLDCGAEWDLITSVEVCNLVDFDDFVNDEELISLGDHNG